MRTARFAEILHLLAANEVEFVVVGWRPAFCKEPPSRRSNLDIVHRRSPENVARLLRVLGQLDAVYRHDPRRLRPQESQMRGPGHQLLTTIHGDLDCLGAVDAALKKLQSGN